MAKKDYDIKIEISIPKREYEIIKKVYYLGMLPLNFVKFVNEFNEEQKKSEGERDKFRKIDIK
ncbi:MAG: hypothetical protein ACP5UV_03895 [Thermoplasmata archaeon]